MNRTRNKKLFLNPPVESKKMTIQVRVIMESQKRNTIVLPQQDDKQEKLQSDLTLNELLYSSAFIRLTLINFHPFLMTVHGLGTNKESKNKSSLPFM